MTSLVYLNGYKIYPFKHRRDLLAYLMEHRFNKILIALNAEKLMEENDNLKILVNNNIGYSDGIGPVLALKRKGFSAVKIAGAELWLNIIEKFYKEKTFYFIGGKQKVIESTVESLQQEFPCIQIDNYCNGYMKPSEQKKLISDIAVKKPDIVFVAMGSPKQELLMQKMHEKHEALYMGLGGSFDIYTKTKKRAPYFFQKLGLEWLYRLIKEPARIKRQLIYIPFILKIIFNRI
jgi:UDP-N-acetyl-D-mannosaminouronate:lipid I N-acetyl-D-mannosaminouronosyltransferase